MTLLLENLGIEVAGISLEPTEESLFNRLGRRGMIEEYNRDIRDYDELSELIGKIRPNYIFHLAAAALVNDSYLDPRTAFSTNVMGTVNVLAAAQKYATANVVCVATTDKVYKNLETGRAFLESDPLEGKDPYSASKVGTESAITAWRKLGEISQGPKLAAFRAGNVIGGGDFAKDRIIPDLVRSRLEGASCKIRNPQSTRPWQHVLDPLIGYVLAANKMSSEPYDPSALNFGPEDKSLSVQELVEIAQKTDNKIPTPHVEQSEDDKRESSFLNLDSSRARSELGWKNVWTQSEAIAASFKWWANVIDGEVSPIEACQREVGQALGKYAQ